MTCLFYYPFIIEKEMEVRVSHRSLEVQGIDREPTRPPGREAAALERKGIRTEQTNHLNILVARNHKSGNLEIRVPVLGNRPFCA